MTTQGSILSVNLGGSAPVGGRPGAECSGIDKRPTSSINVRDPGDRLTGVGSGVVGDAIVDRGHHGGERQAVYAMAREELDYWEGQLGRSLACGAFGENLTTSGIDVDALRIGSLVAIGDDRAVVLEVCSPRIPCATFSAHMGERGWVKAFTARGHPGTYFAVRSPGQIAPGAPLVLTHTPDHDITIADLFRAWLGDLDTSRRVLSAAILPSSQQDALAATLARRTARPRKPVS